MKKQKTFKSKYKKGLWILFLSFVFLNIIAFFHAYKFTHFEQSSIKQATNIKELSTFNKIKALIFGITNPKPANTTKPNTYEVITLQSNKKIECWFAKNSDSSKGTIVLFHGYKGKKSAMLDKAEIFKKLNYSFFLVDFMGCGGSEGYQTTIGFKEAENVKTVFEHLKLKGEKNVFLFGTSMGAVAIMKAIPDYTLKPNGIILECPFGSMYETTCARFKTMGIPAFPMAGLLVFWGGIQNKFWAFEHKPTNYAKNIHTPTLLLHGEKDVNVSMKEINTMYTNLKGTKTLKTYKKAGHENYLIQYKDQWTKDIDSFLSLNNVNLKN